jgi:hypothetical protein
MRRFVSLTCALGLVLVGLSACSGAQQNTVVPAAAQPMSTAQPTGNLCERLVPRLQGKWKAQKSDSTIHIPPADRCS